MGFGHAIFNDGVVVYGDDLTRALRSMNQVSQLPELDELDAKVPVSVHHDD